MGGVRRERSSPAAAKGANSCGVGPQGLTLSSPTRPKGTYELSVETEEAEVQGGGCEVEAALARDGEAVVSDDRPQARHVRQVWRQAGRRRRGCLPPRAEGDALPALRFAARGFEGVPDVEAVAAGEAGAESRMTAASPTLPLREEAVEVFDVLPLAIVQDHSPLVVALRARPVIHRAHIQDPRVDAPLEIHAAAREPATGVGVDDDRAGQVHATSLRPRR